MHALRATICVYYISTNSERKQKMNALNLVTTAELRDQIPHSIMQVLIDAAELPDLERAFQYVKKMLDLHPSWTFGRGGHHVWIGLTSQHGPKRVALICESPELFDVDPVPEIDAAPFVAAHGCEPAGCGKWAFAPALPVQHRDVRVSPRFEYQAAEKWAREQFPNVAVIYLVA
jgi:hypothetical protein